MAYRGFDNLPDAIVSVLPLDAQELFLLASEKASAAYAEPEARPGSSSPEEFAHRVAWILINLLYERGEDGHWRERKPAHETIVASDGNVRWLQVA
jgi:cation transport regulator ChaB